MTIRWTGLRDCNPGSADKHRAIVHYDQLSAHPDRATRSGVVRFMHRREQEAVLTFARLHDENCRSVIDVGCGGGVFARAAKRAGRHVSAVDLAPGMVRAIAPEVDRAWVADVEALTSTSRYDVVICSGVLDFVLDPELAFDNLATLVAPGGRLVVNAPRAGAGGWLYRFDKSRLGMRVNLFSQPWFAVEAGKAGLELRGVRSPLPWNRVLWFERPLDLVAPANATHTLTSAQASSCTQ